MKLLNMLLDSKDERREYILCAAIYYDDGIERVHQPLHILTGIVVCGLRHHNCFATLVELFPKREYKNNAVQGFLTSKNRFVDREFGSRIAFSAGQIENRYPELCSEHLY